MSENLEIDPEKIVHEEIYKVNLGENETDLKEVIPPTQINTEENKNPTEPFVVGKKPILTDEINTGYLHKRVIVTEPSSNLIDVPPGKNALPEAINFSIDSCNGLPQTNIKSDDNPYVIPHQNQEILENKIKENPQTKINQKKKIDSDRDYLKREMHQECRQSRCKNCDIL